MGYKIMIYSESGDWGWVSVLANAGYRFLGMYKYKNIFCPDGEFSKTEIAAMRATLEEKKVDAYICRFVPGGIQTQGEEL